MTADQVAPPRVRPRGDDAVARTVRAATLALLLSGSLYPPLFGVTAAAMAAAFALPLVVWELLRTVPRVPVAIRFGVPLILVLAVPGRLLPIYTEYGEDKLFRLVTFTLLSAVSAALVRDRRDLRNFALAWLASGCVLGIGTFLGSVDSGRATGFDTNPIWLGRMLGSAMVVVFWLYITRRIPIWLATGLGLMLGVALFATGSRGPFSAMVVGALVVFVAGAQRAAARMAALAGVALTTIVGMLGTVDGNDSRIMRFVANPREELQSSIRIDLFSDTLTLISGHPWGVGFGNWQIFVGSTHFDYPHNIWLEAIAEGGIVFGSLLILAAGYVTVRLWRAAHRGNSAKLLLGLVAFELVAVSVSGDLNARSFFAFLTLGFVVARWDDSEDAGCA